MYKLSFGRYVFMWRLERMISQRELARRSGLSNSTISRIESDSVMPDFQTVEKIAQGLGIDKQLLLTKLI